jgi:Tol biopolymer transport system component
MGEVYRARDPRLGREVAVKVLPERFLEGEERKQRFEREARLLAALSHPGIAAVYSFEEDAGRHLLTMELLEGETLRSEMAAGRFPPRKAIDYAIQIAQGLAAAHAKGVIHRDLKPENVFVTRDGRIKILDFGLAKLAQPEGSASISTLPTDTEPGVVMGTLGYISPEQIKTEPADERSDIFALGVILHEMLSGQRPFRGASAAETMAAILREDPPELSATNRNVSPGLERLVRHCLEKSPERRFQSARDLVYDLESLTLDSGAARAPVPRAPSPAARRALAAAAVVALALLGLWGFRSLRPAPGDPTYRRLTFRRGTVYGARFAPDGQTVVYSAAWEGQPARLFATRIGSVESRELQLPDARLLSVSSSSELAILFTRGTDWAPKGTLARVPLEGGAPRAVLDDVSLADWAPDGRDLAVVHSVGGKDRIEYPTGRVLYETGRSIFSTRFSPKGDRIAFSVLAQGIFTVDLSGKLTQLIQGGADAWAVAWRPDGSEIWFARFRAGERWALGAVDLSGLQRPLRREAGAIFLMDVSKEGRALVASAEASGSLVGLFPGASGERELGWMDQPTVNAMSDDGRHVVFDEWGESAGQTETIYVRATDGSAAVRLGKGHGLAFSPDGQWVLSWPSSTSETFVLLPTGAGQPRPLPHSGIVSTHFCRFFPGGKSILFQGRVGAGSLRFYTQDLEGGEPRPVSPDGIPDGFAAIAPDGRSFAAQGPDSRIAIFPADGAGAARPVAGVEPGETPVSWSADGRSLYVYRSNEAPARVFRVEVATGKRALWRTLAPADRCGLTAIDSVVMTPDARSYAFTYGRLVASVHAVDGLR